MRTDKTIRPNDDILLLHTNPLTVDRSVPRPERIDDFWYRYIYIRIGWNTLLYTTWRESIYLYHIRRTTVVAEIVISRVRASRFGLVSFS